MYCFIMYWNMLNCYIKKKKKHYYIRIEVIYFILIWIRFIELSENQNCHSLFFSPGHFWIFAIFLIGCLDTWIFLYMNYSVPQCFRACTFLCSDIFAMAIWNVDVLTNYRHIHACVCGGGGGDGTDETINVRLSLGYNEANRTL